MFWGVTYLPKAVFGLVLLWVGWKLIGTLVTNFEKLGAKKNWDASLNSFISSLFSVALKIALVITVAGMLGIETTSFVAVFGAMALAIGLALQGSVGNFAGGVLILTFRPFKVGDVIEAQGHSGTVKEIKIFNSVLLTPDNRTVIVPNGALSSGTIINFSNEKLRRVDWVFAASYDNDLVQVKNAIHEVLASIPKIHKDPAPFVRVGEFSDSSIKYSVNAWVAKEDYGQVYFDVLEQTKLKFDEMKLSVPFPRHDVHLYGNVQELGQLYEKTNKTTSATVITKN